MENSQEEVVYGSDAAETTHEGSTGSQDVSTDNLSLEYSTLELSFLYSMVEFRACVSETTVTETVALLATCSPVRFSYQFRGVITVGSFVRRRNFGGKALDASKSRHTFQFLEVSEPSNEVQYTVEFRAASSQFRLCRKRWKIWRATSMLNLSE